MAHLHHSLRIEAPIDQVYRIARDPETWAMWFVGLTGPERVTGSGEVGTVADFELTLAGMRFPVAVEVMEDTALPEGATWVGKIDGPFEGQQRWSYRPHGGETEVTVEVDYAVPGSVLGKLADKIIIERMMERNFEHSAENLKMICEGS
ncbi:MAG TPA: SRPBCC family protein [Thermoleophilia bacterium]|nr:SRPBCC family protein [Thermoleophilia bacterium]